MLLLLLLLLLPLAPPSTAAVEIQQYTSPTADIVRRACVQRVLGRARTLPRLTALCFCTISVMVIHTLGGKLRRRFEKRSPLSAISPHRAAPVATPS